jgi:nicotinamidase-related amidase
MTHTALLVLDVQNELVDPAGKVGSQGFAKVVEQRDLLRKTAAVIAAMRAKQQPVAYVNVGFRADYADAISRSKRLGPRRIATRNCRLIRILLVRQPSDPVARRFGFSN